MSRVQTRMMDVVESSDENADVGRTPSVVAGGEEGIRCTGDVCRWRMRGKTIARQSSIEGNR